MVTFRNNNNNRRNNFRRTERSLKQTAKDKNLAQILQMVKTLKEKAPGRNNHNASKLIEKYNDLAREALSNGDKILSENYLQHADHFTRILNERESFRKEKFSEINSRIIHLTEVNDDISQNNDKDKDKDIVQKSDEEAKISKLKNLKLKSISLIL